MQVKDEYSKVIRRKYPEQVVIAIVKDGRGKFNPITLGWTTIVSHEPPMMAIAVAHGRHSREAIEETKEFVLAYPSSSMAEAALFYGTNSGKDLDKLERHPVATEPALEVDSLLLTDAVANFECKLESQLETGDHIIYVGRVVASHANADSNLQRLYSIASGHKMGAVGPR